jgi:hypothetical protein
MSAECDARDILLAKLRLLGLRYGYNKHNDFLDIWAPRGFRFVCNQCSNYIKYRKLEATKAEAWTKALEDFDRGFEKCDELGLAQFAPEALPLPTQRVTLAPHMGGNYFD